jgi:hypothetical protein
MNNNSSTLRLSNPVPYTNGAGFFLKGCYDKKKKETEFNGVWSSLSLVKCVSGYIDKFNGSMVVERNTFQPVSDLFNAIKKFEEEAIDLAWEARSSFRNYDLLLTDKEDLRAIFKSAISIDQYTGKETIMLVFTKNAVFVDDTGDVPVLIDDRGRIMYEANLAAPRIHYGELSFNKTEHSLVHKITATQCFVYNFGQKERPKMDILDTVPRDFYTEMAKAKKLKVEEIEAELVTQSQDVYGDHGDQTDFGDLSPH